MTGRVRGIPLLLSLAALPLALLPPAAQAQAVSPEEIKSTWVGKPLSGTAGNGRSFILTFAADGTVTISGEAANDSGTWRLSDTGYCATWKVIRQGQERCFTARKLGNGEIRVINPDGSTSGHIAPIQ